MKVRYTRKGLGGVTDEEVRKNDLKITIFFKKVPAFIDVCIKGLVDCLLDDFIEGLPMGRGFTEEEATEVS